MDLGNIKTNRELKLCIDYVKTSSHNGGVIIFEDIDCMTDIVKSRSNNAKYNLVPVSETEYTAVLPEENSQPNSNNEPTITKTANAQNDALSLSFLLNM